MSHLIDASHIAVLVSHDLDLIRQMCTRVLWLDRGQIVEDGGPGDVCRAYLQHAARQVMPAIAGLPDQPI